MTDTDYRELVETLVKQGYEREEAEAIAAFEKDPNEADDCRDAKNPNLRRTP